MRSNLRVRPTFRRTKSSASRPGGTPLSHRVGTSSPAPLLDRNRRALHRLVLVSATFLASLLAWPGVASALTNGFDVVNASSATMTLSSISGFQYGIAAPPTGSPIATANRHHLEITFQFLDSNSGTVTYLLYRGNNYVGQVRANLTVVAIDRNDLSSCSVTSVSGYAWACVANGSTITVLDPPGTLYNVPPEQRQAQANVLRQLCIDQTVAVTCSFAANSEVSVESPQHPTGGYVQNTTDVDQETTVHVGDKVGESNSVGVTITAGGTLFEVVKASVEASYGHEWTREHTFEQDVRVTAPPHNECDVLGTAPMLRDTGDFAITLGNSTWRLPNVYFDTPDPNHAGRYGYTIVCYKLSSKFTGPRAPAIYTVPRTASRRPIARPRLKLRIIGPPALHAGERGEYRVVLARAQPPAQLVYLPGDVRVRIRVAGRTLRSWKISSLPLGRPRSLRFGFTVPKRGVGALCVTAEARASHAIGARARDCAVLMRGPLSGLG